MSLKSFVAFSAALTIALGSSGINAAQSFGSAKKKLEKLYRSHPEVKTFYCGCEIDWNKGTDIPNAQSCGYEPRKPITRKGNPNRRATRIEWEHVMPAYWFGRQLACWRHGGRKACHKDPVFKKIEGDMHNLFPAVGELNGDRNNFRFSELEGEPRKYGACDFEVDFKLKKAEPPPQVKGDIARVYFYMADEYDLKLSKSQKRLLEAWNKYDPVDDWERTRNKLIKSIQGNTNKFIN